MMDTNEKNMLWNAVAVDMLSTVQEFCGTGLKQKNWDGKSTRERKKTRLAAQCANRHTHTHSANECGVCWQRECNRPVECVYILYCIYIYIQQCICIPDVDERGSMCLTLLLSECTQSVCFVMARDLWTRLDRHCQWAIQDSMVPDVWNETEVTMKYRELVMLSRQ